MSADFYDNNGPLTQFPNFDVSQIQLYTTVYSTRYSGVHCKEDPIYVFPEMKLRGLVSNFHIHVSVGDLYIPTISLPILHICFEFSVQCLCSVGG
jgi:hypothetical protein